MSEWKITEADQFIYLCNEAVREGEWLARVDPAYADDDLCSISLVGIKPRWHALVLWTRGSGFSVKISGRDSYYSDPGTNLVTAEEVFSLASRLCND